MIFAATAPPAVWQCGGRVTVSAAGGGTATGRGANNAGCQLARARNIKPGFFTNDQLAEVSALGRLLFIGLWCMADRAGRLEDRPKKIRAEVLPYDDCDPDALLSELAHRGFILRYTYNNCNYIQIVKFEKHQNPHVKEGQSTIPAPDLPGANTIRATLIPDSGFRIPDTRVEAMSGKPDVVALKVDRSNSERREAAREILGFLNAKTGRNYRLVDANLGPIMARMKEGATVRELRAVIARKCREWGSDEKMMQYLRPATLFNATKFNQYVGEVPPAEMEATQ